MSGGWGTGAVWDAYSAVGEVRFLVEAGPSPAASFLGKYAGQRLFFGIVGDDQEPAAKDLL